MIDTPEITETAAQLTAIIRLTVPRPEIQNVMGPDLGQAWGEFDAWIASKGLTPGKDLWERCVAGPESGPDPSTWRTELNRPLAD